MNRRLPLQAQSQSPSKLAAASAFLDPQWVLTVLAHSPKVFKRKHRFASTALQITNRTLELVEGASSSPECLFCRPQH